MKDLRLVDAPLPSDLPAVECLPALLLSLLERRYLSDFHAGDWRLSLASDPAHVLLSEVTALGRRMDEPISSMAAALSACHEPGQAVVMGLHGAPDADIGQRHRLYYGARRLPGGPASDAYLQGQAGSLSAHFPGLEMEAATPLRVHGDLARFLRTAPALAAVTGIPSSSSAAGMGLERLIRSVGAREYALLVVAEPLPITSADSTLDACRKLQSDISAYIHRQVSRTRGEGSSRELTTGIPQRSVSDRIPGYLQQCAGYVAAVTGQPILAVLTMAASMASEANQPLPEPVQRESHSENWSASATVSFVDMVAKSIDELLSRHVVRIQTGRGWGWWRAAIYLATESEATLQAVGRAVKAIAATEVSGLDPLRLVKAPHALLRDAMMQGRVIDLHPVAQAPGHPLGPAYDSLATCMTSGELAALVAPPRSEVSGLRVRDRGEFAHSLPQPSEPAFELGRVHDVSGNDRGAALITARALNEHVLVVGTPGSGKTNTCMRILLAVHEQFHVPFLVIEPAKAEYRQLQRWLGNRLKIFSVGDPRGAQLRLNPLAPVPGAPLLGHIDLLKAVFNASFTMHPGMPQILEQALYEVYQERGWNLSEGTHDEIASGLDPLDAAAFVPCLADLRDQVERVMQQKGYAGEVRMNLGAALRSRLNGLMLGAKGLSLNVRRGTPDSALFDHPVVLELQHLRDDEEKAFVIAAVFMRLYQYCEVRQRLLPTRRRERLQHLTLIEEAHRLLTSVSGDEGGARGKAVCMFTDMLSELRALGEGFAIAEQIPTKLTPDALKNTNLKIVHRLTAASERLAAGQSANLKDAQMGHLANLSKGLAVVHGLSAGPHDPMADAALVQIAAVKSADAPPDLDVASGETRPESAWRHGGCRSCLAPCEFLARAEMHLARDPRRDWMRSFGVAALENVADRAWKLWTRWRSRREDQRRSDGSDYCFFVHAARHWLDQLLAARGRSREGSCGLRSSDRLVLERLSAGFGRLARCWLQQSELSSAAVEELAGLSRLLQQEVYEGAPPDLDGCDNCPARCRLLPFVIGIEQARSAAVAQTIVKGAMDAFGHPTTSESRWHRAALVLSSLADQLTPPPNVDAALWRRDWRYCLMTNIDLPAEVSAHRQEILDSILKGPPRS